MSDKYTPTQWSALKTEIATDPLGLGYASRVVVTPGQPKRPDDEAIAKLMNERRRSVDRPTIMGAEVFGAITFADRQALALTNAPAVAWLDVLSQVPGEIPVFPQLRQTLRNLFPNNSDSDNRLQALLRRDAGRAEELGFLGLNESDVAYARNYIPPTP